MMGLDVNKDALLYWIRYYNTHYFALPEEERCTEYALDHDILFDHFLEQKEFREKTKHKTNRRSATEAQEVIQFG